MGFTNPFIQDILASNSSRIHSHSKGNIMYTKKDMEQMLYDLLEDQVDKEQPRIIEESKEEPLTEYQKELLQSISEDVGDGKDSLMSIPQEIFAYVKAIENGEEKLDMERVEGFAKRIEQVTKNNHNGLSDATNRWLKTEIAKKLRDEHMNVDKLFEIAGDLNTKVHNIFKFDPENFGMSPDEKRLHDKMFEKFVSSI
jgi:molecular chaperone GrpE (heat shock protein)